MYYLSHPQVRTGSTLLFPFIETLLVTALDPFHHFTISPTPSLHIFLTFLFSLLSPLSSSPWISSFTPEYSLPHHSFLFQRSFSSVLHPLPAFTSHPNHCVINKEKTLRQGGCVKGVLGRWDKRFCSFVNTINVACLMHISTKCTHDDPERSCLHTFAQCTQCLHKRRL